MFLGEVTQNVKQNHHPKLAAERLSQQTQTAASVLVRSYRAIWLIPVPTWRQRSRHTRGTAASSSQVVLNTAHFQPSKTSFTIGNQKYDTHFFISFFFPQLQNSALLRNSQNHVASESASNKKYRPGSRVISYTQNPI